MIQTTLSIFVCDTIFVSDEVVVEVVIVRITGSGSPSFSAREIVEFREVLRISMGSHADYLSDEELRDLGTSMLRATAVVLLAKYRREERDYYLRGIRK